MINWNVEQLSRSYRRQAEEAERYCKEVRGKISVSPSYKAIFDEHVAKFSVYNYLHGRTFLSSKAELLSELRRMLSFSASSSECFDEARFETYRRMYINYEIALHEGA